MASLADRRVAALAEFARAKAQGYAFNAWAELAEEKQLSKRALITEMEKAGAQNAATSGGWFPNGPASISSRSTRCSTR